MKVAALLLLAVALSLAGIATDRLIERNDCLAVTGVALSFPPCDGYQPLQTHPEKLEWFGSALLLVVSGVLFRVRRALASSASRGVRPEPYASNVRDAVASRAVNTQRMS